MSENKSIFAIEEEYAKLMLELEEAEGEITPELADALEVSEVDRDKKMQSYAYIIKAREASVKTIKDESARLAKIKKLDETLAKKLKGVLLNALEFFDLRNKNGNLAYRLQYHNLFTKETKAVIENQQAIDTVDTALYEDVIQFTLKDKLTRQQALMIESVLSGEDENYLIPTFSRSIDKEVFKDKIQIATDLPENTEEEVEVKEAELNRLYSIGEVVDNISLTIR